MKEINSNNETIFFSIIVPVYNVEHYLDQCLESILTQNYSNFEVLLINDGSKDSSLEICKKYKQIHDKIILIDKENGGVSDARNTGLKTANGEYIFFCDSDDYWVGSDTLLNINNLIKESKADLIIHEESRFFSKRDIVYKHNQKFLKNKKGNFTDEIINLVYYDLYAPSPCDKIIKRSILIENELFFPTDKRSEDIEWTGKLMYHIETFSIYSKSFYFYRQARKGSFTTNIDEKNVIDIYTMVKNGLKNQQTNSEKMNLAVENYWACIYVIILKEFYVLSPKWRKEIWNDLYDWKYLLQWNRNLKVDKVMFFYKYLSFRFLIFFLNGYRIKTSFYKKHRASK